MTTRENKKRCGLDIGGTQIKAVVLDDTFQVIEELTIPSNASSGPPAVKTAIFEVIQKFLDNGHSLSFVGIGCAGSVDSVNGVIRNSPNFANWENVELAQWVREGFNLPVKVNNDANCATLAEWHLGEGRGIENLILITLGTGVGGGLILQNRLYQGSTGTGGELGHFSINSNGIICPCGNRGCFERYCSASALKAQLPGLSTKNIFDGVHTDKQCRQLVSDFLHHLKIGLTSLANIFDPDLILLGGGISKGIVPYIDEIRSWVKATAFPAVGAHLKIEFTKHHNNSGAIGAALLDLDR